MLARACIVPTSSRVLQCAALAAQVLLERAPKRSAATLRGFKRQCIQEQVFPALVPSDPADALQGWV